MKTVDMAEVAAQYGIPAAEIKLAYSRKDLMALIRNFASPLSHALLDNARVLGIPSQKIGQMRTNADLTNAIKEVDMRAVARDVGVPEAQMCMAFDREDLMDMIRAAVDRNSGGTQQQWPCGPRSAVALPQPLEMDIAKVARGRGVPPAEVGRACSREDAMAPVRSSGSSAGSLSHALLEDARMLGIPSDQIVAMRTDAELRRALKKVDIRSVARDVGVSEAQVNMAFNRDDLVDMIRATVRPFM
eukprot:TRINITY_DN13304_c0_g1_i4.p1 TRINITY_DN13304_c0_g1~~TRINITY_DN13304_c0_g1_i4.p1  ORF type:complete len:245 (-),score=44.17 TRINITY_DN13304_c0_g1_i4:256-990(-)